MDCFVASLLAMTMSLSASPPALILVGGRLHGRKHRAALDQSADQPLQHHQPMTAADSEGSAGVGEDAPFFISGHVFEIVEPIREHTGGGHQTGHAEEL